SAQDLRPALHVLTRQVQGVVHLVRDVLRQVLAHPGADVLAELLFFRGECQVHGVSYAMSSPRRRGSRGGGGPGSRLHGDDGCNYLSTVVRFGVSRWRQTE